MSFFWSKIFAYYVSLFVATNKKILCNKLHSITLCFTCIYLTFTKVLQFRVDKFFN